ncbi:MAG: MFS transporter [Pseudomonadota bacterium]
MISLQPYFVAASAFFIMLLLYGGYYAFGIFFTPVLTEFGWTRAMTSGAFSLSLLIMGLLGIAMGGFTDRFGPQRVMTLCGVLLGIGYFLMSRIHATWQFYLVYGIIIGTGMGASFVPLMSTVARWFITRRNLMSGIVTSGIGFGFLLGPPAAHFLIVKYGWRVSYLILGAVICIAVVLSAQMLKKQPVYDEKETTPLKGEGEILLKMQYKDFSLRQAAHTTQFWTLLGLFFCFGFCLFAVTVHIAPLIIEGGLLPGRAAKILAAIGGMSIFGKIVLGRIGDNIGSKNTFLIGFLMMSVALFWLLKADKEWMFYVFSIVFGFAYGGCVVSESPIVALMFGLSSHGLILGILCFAFTIGGALGPFLTGYIFDLKGTYHLAIIICSAVSAIAFLLTATLKSR